MFDFVTKQLLHLSVACRGGGERGDTRASKPGGIQRV